MKSKLFVLLLLGGIVPVCALRSETADSLRNGKTYPIGEVVVTGTRHETDVRHLPMTISVVGRQKIVEGFQPSLLPTLTEQIPGLFVTGRGIMGYGVSGGAAGQMTLRGVGGGPTTGLLVLIDGHPQYMGLMGHPIADACQSMLADRVEVVRGPASVLYGSNAMGGVINIVTRRMHEDGVKTDLHAGYGSYNTLETEVTNQVRAGRFTSTVTGSYNGTDGHRRNMGFEQYGGYAKLGYRIAQAWDLYADVNLTHFNAQNPGAVSAPILDNKQHITRGMTSFTLRNDYGKTSGTLSFFYNWGRHRINDGHSPGEEPLNYRFNSRDRMLGVSWYQSVALFRGNRLTVGVDWQHFGGKAWNAFTDGAPDKTTADKTMDEAAGYVDFRQSLTHWLTLDAGLRLDHHSHAGTEWVPQGGLSFLQPQVENLMENMIESMLHEHSDEDVMNQYTMGLVFLYLLNHLENLSHNSSMDYRETIVQAVLGYIKSDCKNANLTKIAKDTHQSVSVLSKLIRQKTGYTFKELLQQRRFETAAHLLTETDLAVEEIALDVGYENLSYFFRQFKSRYGVTPRAYRMMNSRDAGNLYEK